jgi:hypothetical protein
VRVPARPFNTGSSAGINPALSQVASKSPVATTSPSSLVSVSSFADRGYSSTPNSNSADLMSLRSKPAPSLLVKPTEKKVQEGTPSVDEISAKAFYELKVRNGIHSIFLRVLS